MAYCVSLVLSFADIKRVKTYAYCLLLARLRRFR